MPLFACLAGLCAGAMATKLGIAALTGAASALAYVVVKKLATPAVDWLCSYGLKKFRPYLFNFTKSMFI